MAFLVSVKNQFQSSKNQFTSLFLQPLEGSSAAPRAFKSQFQSSKNQFTSLFLQPRRAVLQPPRGRSRASSWFYFCGPGGHFSSPMGLPESLFEPGPETPKGIPVIALEPQVIVMMLFSWATQYNWLVIEVMPETVPVCHVMPIEVIPASHVYWDSFRLSSHVHRRCSW